MEMLEDFDFADDICYFAQSLKDMKNKIDDLVLEAQKGGLKFNASKTKEMRLNSQGQENLAIEERVVVVDKFCYSEACWLPMSHLRDPRN